LIPIIQTQIELLEKTYNKIPTTLSLNLPKGKTIKEIKYWKLYLEDTFANSSLVGFAEYEKVNLWKNFTIVMKVEGLTTTTNIKSYWLFKYGNSTFLSITNKDNDCPLLNNLNNSNKYYTVISTISNGNKIEVKVLEDINKKCHFKSKADTTDNNETLYIWTSVNGNISLWTWKIDYVEVYKTNSN
jgi:hypothetical protein